MDEKQRTKVLGGTLAGILAFMAGKPLLMGPINDAKRDQTIAYNQLEDAEVKDLEVDRALQRIEDGQFVSLPPQVSDAQRLYQSWINNLAEQSNFSQLAVTPGRTEELRDQYIAVNIDVEGEASMEGLSRFLYLFEQADLQHRISDLEIKSTGTQGSPQMKVKLTAQGMSVSGSSSKGDLFAKTYLPEKLTDETAELTVAESADFPTEGSFLAQIGREMVEVESIEGNKWKVTRGVQGTKATSHDDNEYAQLFPVYPGRKDVSFDDYEDFVKASLFVKPAKKKEYSPELDVSDQTVHPGETVKLSARAKDLNPDIGVAVFAVTGAEEDMKFNEETGELEWTPAEDAEPTEYKLTFMLTQKNNDDLKIEKTAKITVQLPNDDPKLIVPEEVAVILGREFELEVKAEDDGETSDLTFSLEGAPQGLSIDGAKLKWEPPKTFTPGNYEVTVKVTDSGTPQKSASSTLKLKVQDDTAALTRFTAAVGRDGENSAWFWNQVENKRPELKVGDRLSVADIDVELTEISKRHVLLTDAKGVWKLTLGETVRDRTLIQPVEEKEAEDKDDTTEDKAENPADYDADPPKADAKDTSEIDSSESKKDESETIEADDDETPAEQAPEEAAPASGEKVTS